MGLIPQYYIMTNFIFVMNAFFSISEEIVSLFQNLATVQPT